MKRSLLHIAYPYLLLIPAFILIFSVLCYPLIASLVLSFHKWTFSTYGEGRVPFIGLGNFIEMSADPYFWRSIVNTLIFSGSSLVMEFFLGLGVALLLNRKLVGTGMIRTLVILPFVLSNAVIGLNWRLMYNYDYGIINYFLSIFAIKPILWLSDPTKAMLSVIIVDVWNCTSFVVLLLLSGLQAIPQTPYEAAKIDGATGWQVFRFITLPLLRPVILVVLIWRTMDLFRCFDMIYILTGGGPGHATEVLSIYSYYKGFRYFNLGYAAAAAWVLVALIMIVCLGYLKLVRSEIID